jgi:hypothetical protein
LADQPHRVLNAISGALQSRVAGSLRPANTFPRGGKAITTAAIAEIENGLWAKSIEPIEIEVIFYLERPATVSVAKRPWPIKPPDL